MNDNYILKHKDKACGLLAIDRDSGALTEFEVIDGKYLPFLGNADLRHMKIWWKHRSVPGNRKDMEDVFRRAGCETGAEYLAKNLALSLTDCYWICPLDIELEWDDINLYKSSMPEGILTLYNGTSFDPNASLGGQMNKYWDISGERPILVKKAYEYHGQQSVNELFATEVHSGQESGVAYVRYYGGDAADNAKVSCCEAFTSEQVEFVSAYEVLCSRKLKKSRADYDQFIDICEENGLNRAEVQQFMDYMILTDFAVSNIDEHLHNFGVLRDSDTMDLIGPAPIFDNGNSMFFNMNGSKPLSRQELLDCRISSFHTSEEKMLKHVMNKDIIDISRLPSETEVRTFYMEQGIPETKANFISGSYSKKIDMLKDFQNGMTISLYNEKRKK